MKRKLNENDVPEEIPAAATTASTTTPSAPVAFTDLGLDPRLLQAITKENFAEPTPVQAKAIPLALEGRDVLGMIFAFSSKIITNTGQPARKQAQAKRRLTSFPFFNPFSSESQQPTHPSP